MMNAVTKITALYAVDFELWSNQSRPQEILPSNEYLWIPKYKRLVLGWEHVEYYVIWLLQNSLRTHTDVRMLRKAVCIDNLQG